MTVAAGVAGAQEGFRKRYLSAFEAGGRGRNGAPAWLRDLRQEAIARFAAVGVPTTRDEDWRYTSLAPIVEGSFGLAAEEPTAGGATGAPDDGLGPLGGPHLVLVNGRPVARPAGPTAAETGIRVVGLAEAIREEPELVRRHLGRQAGADGHGLLALSTAFAGDGALIQVGAGRRAPGPVHLVAMTRSPHGATLAQPRLLVVLEPGAELVLVESHLGEPDGAYWVNAVAEVVVGAGARFDHVRIQDESRSAYHLSHLRATVGPAGRLATCAVSLGGRLVRQEVHLTLDGEGAEVAVNGLYVVGGRQHVDTHTVIDHRQPHGTSRQLHKGVLDGHARAVFSGRVVVRPGAQKTDAQQTNKNLLLSEGVEVDSRPQLEIFADDVKCTHGAADGQPAADAMFYLRSRGLGEASARGLLTYGFAAEVLGRIAIEPVRSRLEAMLGARMGVPPALEGTMG